MQEQFVTLGVFEHETLSKQDFIPHPKHPNTFMLKGIPGTFALLSNKNAIMIKINKGLFGPASLTDGISTIVIAHQIFDHRLPADSQFWIRPHIEPVDIISHEDFSRQQIFKNVFYRSKDGISTYANVSGNKAYCTSFPTCFLDGIK